MEGRVDVQESLHEVVARGKGGETLERVAIGAAVDDGLLARCERVDVLSEEGHRSILTAPLAELETGLGIGLPSDDHEDTAVDGLALNACRKGNLEAQAGRPIAGSERLREKEDSGCRS